MNKNVIKYDIVEAYHDEGPSVLVMSNEGTHKFRSLHFYPSIGKK